MFISVVTEDSAGFVGGNNLYSPLCALNLKSRTAAAIKLALLLNVGGYSWGGAATDVRLSWGLPLVVGRPGRSELTGSPRGPRAQTDEPGTAKLFGGHWIAEAIGTPAVWGHLA
ncbi:hypothetical protein CBR_g53684 [Chara braunii]|uniref:Uncharacterized protein n=1 Tax=Chara braunii TaxID=69332 RepID=A0A388MBA9_CHABU|nr:hypothetical protein CBR_g53684 [Chara braunii]|eukprot:GBG91795.1 hypothetical protein CBR_g53684 [Chara braunii]